MFHRLGFSQVVTKKLVEDQGIYSQQTLANLFEEDICDVIGRHCGLVDSKMPDRWNQISLLAAKNLKFGVFVFKSMECCSKPYDMKHVNSKEVLEY